jgi:hypothetical protein
MGVKRGFLPNPKTAISIKLISSFVAISVKGEIVVQGGTHCGMATIFDYDIFLYMVSYLTHEMNKVREEIKKGNDNYLP